MPHFRTAMPNFGLTLHRIDVQTRVVINNQTDAEHIFRGLTVLPPFKVERWFCGAWETRGSKTNQTTLRGGRGKLHTVLKGGGGGELAHPTETKFEIVWLLISTAFMLSRGVPNLAIGWASAICDANRINFDTGSCSGSCCLKRKKRVFLF